MELRQLRCVVALAEELHFGRAARRLALTQPPLSQAIRNLEDELGVRLFERTRRRVALTQAGAAFAEEARATLARVAEAAERARRADRGEVGRLAVGFLAATAHTLLPLILRDFKARRPEVILDLRELTPPQLGEALRRREIQVGLVRPPVPDAELASEVILEEPFVLALPARHPLGRLSRVPVTRLASEPFVTFRRLPGRVFPDQVMGFCLGAGFTPRVAQEVNQVHTVIGLVAAGIGVALVPASARTIGLPGVLYRPLRETTPRAQLALAWPRADASPVLAAFLDTARRVARRFAARGGRWETRRAVRGPGAS
jgi:DNA-binding transcriptional LysR family regulator